MFYCQLEKKPPTFSTLRGNSCLSSQVGFGFPGGESISDILNFHFTLSFTSIWLISNIIPGIGIFWLWKISFFHGNFQRFFFFFYHLQFSSVAQSCPTLCNPMNHSTPGLPVQQQLQEFTQTHVHRVSDAIQPSHPLSSPYPSAPNPSQHQGLFQWVNSSHEVAKVLEFQL